MNRPTLSLGKAAQEAARKHLDEVGTGPIADPKLIEIDVKHWKRKPTHVGGTLVDGDPTDGEVRRALDMEGWRARRRREND